MATELGSISQVTVCYGIITLEAKNEAMSTTCTHQVARLHISVH